jgi:hypothetical protein
VPARCLQPDADALRPRRAPGRGLNGRLPIGLLLPCREPRENLSRSRRFERKTELPFPGLFMLFMLFMLFNSPSGGVRAIFPGRIKVPSSRQVACVETAFVFAPGFLCGLRLRANPKLVGCLGARIRPDVRERSKAHCIKLHKIGSFLRI